jgi:hypothetical protein
MTGTLAAQPISGDCISDISYACINDDGISDDGISDDWYTAFRRRRAHSGLAGLTQHLQAGVLISLWAGLEAASLVDRGLVAGWKRQASWRERGLLEDWKVQASWIEALWQAGSYKPRG